MAGRFATKHQSAHRSVAKNGRAVVFAPDGVTNYDPLTDTSTPPSGSVSGVAIDVKPDLQEYRANGWIVGRTRTLFFVPDTYGQLPEQDMTVSLEGQTFFLKQRVPIAPDGVPIAARLVLSQ